MRTWCCRARAAPTRCCRRCCALPDDACGQHAGAGLPQRVSCRLPAGRWQAPGAFWRVHLEVHAQRVRLQRAGQYADHVPDRLAQLQDPGIHVPPRMCPSRMASRRSGAVVGGRAVLWAAGCGRGSDGRCGPGTTYYPFRIDHDEKFNQTTHFQYPIPCRAVAWVQLQLAL